MVVFFACLLALSFLLFLKAVFDERKKKAEKLSELEADFGKKQGNTTTAEALQRLRERAPSRGEMAEEGFIDDITWQDLELDEVFRRMNTTLSLPGEEALYDLLRHPLLEEEGLRHRGEILRFFAENPKERVKLQEAFLGMGRTKKYVLSDYLSLLDSVREESNFRHYLSVLLGLAAISLIFLKPAAGFAAVIAVLIFNVATYFRRKGEIDPYLVVFSWLLRALKEVKTLPDLKEGAVREELQTIRDTAAALSPLFRGSFLLLAGRDLTGNLWEIPLDYLRIFFHLDLIRFNSMLSFVRAHRSEVETLFSTVGFLDAMIAAASFRMSLPVWCEPEFTGKTESCYEAEGLCHPLLSDPVPCSICSSGKGVLVSGSNASGKSTFLKSAALSILLSQTIFTAAAGSLKLSFFALYSSMSLRDSLLGGESYYMAEIKAVKRIADRAGKGEVPTACFLDELLRGTNTVERIAASSEILRRLQKKNTLIFAATHDMELTGILEECYDNYHFEDEVRGEDLFFSYQLKEGKAKTRNAIRLLSLIGFDEETTRSAFEAAEVFEKTGVWKRS